MARLIYNVIMPGAYSNYLVGTNVCNSFAAGELFAEDDFWMVAKEPPDETSMPLISGNVLDSEGQLLFRLENSEISFNPANCSYEGNQVGYTIRDSTGKEIISVETRYHSLPPVGEQFITTIRCSLYDKQGQLVVSGSHGSRLEIRTKAVLGCAPSGALGIVLGIPEAEIGAFRDALLSS